MMGNERRRLCVSCAHAELRKGDKEVKAGLYCAKKDAGVMAIRTRQSARVSLSGTCERWEKWRAPSERK